MRLTIGYLLLLATAGGLLQGQSTTPSVQAVVNAADYSNALVAGGYITIFGERLAGATAVAQTTPFPTQLGGVSVEVRETTAAGATRNLTLPLYYVSSGQISGLLPYGVGGSGSELVVVNGGQRSAAQRLTVQAAGPRLFTYSQLGTGTAVLTRASNQLVSATTPMRPGEVMQLYLNSAGPVTPELTAGAVSGDGGASGPLRLLTTAPELTVNGRKADVTFAGMSPGSVGLYQINFRAPYEELEGDMGMKVKVGTAESQNGVFVRVLPNGYYWAVTGGQAQNGLGLDGVSGSNSAFAVRHADQEQWGTTGLRQWSKNTGLPQLFSAAKGLALTMRNGTQIVFDNNGLESRNTQGYYDNRGGGPDGQKSGLLSMFSNSVRRALVTAGAFRVTQPTTVTELIGYFEGPSFLRAIPFFPDSYYNRYRMNIWSNTGSNEPRETGDFTGDVMSSERVAGRFSTSPTGVSRVFQNGTANEIYRLRYELERPLVLQPGTYWFGHDVAVPQLSPATTSATSGKESRREVKPGRIPYSMKDDE